LLNSQQETEIAERTGGTESSPADMTDTEVELDGRNAWGRYEEHRHLPVRAIVKDFVASHNPFTPAQIPDMWKDLEDLHKLGILVRDIGVGNYMGGKLIDFSRAWVMPHPGLETMNPDHIQSEPDGLMRTIDECGVLNGWTSDKVLIPDDLLDCYFGRGKKGRYGTDPRQYKWRKQEKDSAVMEAFLARVYPCCRSLVSTLGL
jgi:hypothetical protein